MAQATSTTLGEIKLAGDLAGSTNALAPELTATGVVAGSYALPKITVDAKGRILTAAASTIADILGMFPDATKTSKGVVQVGANIQVAITGVNATQTIFFNPGLVQTNPIGFCSNAPNYSATFIVNGVSYNYSVASTALTTVKSLMDSITGFIPVTGFMTLVNGNLVFNGSAGSGQTVAIINDNLFRFIPGFQSIGAAVNGNGTNTIYVNDASTTQKGVVQAGTGLTTANGLMSVDTSNLIATAQTPGLVKVGSGLTMTNGVLSANVVADATSTTKGLVQVGSNISVAAGVISVPEASLSSKGVVQVGPGLIVDVNGVVSVDPTMAASSSTPGLVKIGSGIVINNGVISVSANPTGSIAGLVKIGAGVTIDGSGTISTTAGAIADATTSSKGLVQIGNGLQVTNGVVSVPDATGAQKGVVQLSSNFQVSGGVTDVVWPTATGAAKGLVQIGSGLSVDGAGVVSANLPDATAGSKGVVQVGSGLSVAAGVISANAIADATTSSKGIVQINTNSGLSVSAGVLSANLASSAAVGVVKSANTNNIVITNGLIDVGPQIPKTTTGNTWTKGYCTAPTTIAYAATETINCDSSNVFITTLSGAITTFAAPINAHPGQVFKLIIKQDATGGRTATFDPVFRFDSNGSTLSTGANKIDMVNITCIDSSTFICRMIKGF